MPKKVSKSKCSESTKKTCKSDKCPKLACKEKVDVDLRVCPEVKVIPKKQTKGEFEVELDIKHKPKCYVELLKDTKLSDCHGKCKLRVCVVNDVELCPTIINKCDPPTASFDVDIAAFTKQTCAIRKHGRKDY